MVSTLDKICIVGTYTIDTSLRASVSVLFYFTLVSQLWHININKSYKKMW